jgi:hypothetical protein
MKKMNIFQKIAHHHRDGHGGDNVSDEETGLVASASTVSTYSNGAGSEGLDTYDVSGDPDYEAMRDKQDDFAKANTGSSAILFSMQENIQDKIEELKEEYEHVVVGSSQGPKRDLSYDQANHLVVLLRMYGSIWPKVLPYCIVNVIWTFVIYYLSKHTSVDLTLHSNAAHTFMSTLGK